MVSAPQLMKHATLVMACGNQSRLWAGTGSKLLVWIRFLEVIIILIFSVFFFSMQCHIERFETHSEEPQEVLAGIDDH